MPVIHLDINDDEEFTSCNYCKSSVQRYNNTSLSTTSIHSLYTKTLINYHHLNCQKCGLYIEMHPPHPTPDQGLIFLCSKSIPCKHCMCYECGLLYDLNPDTKKQDIINQLQYHPSTPSTPTQIEPQTQSSNILNATNITNVGIMSNSTFIAEVMNEMSSNQSNDVQTDTADGWTLFIGTIMALFVWFGIYWSSPELFRLTGCFVWFGIFYYISALFFTENEAIQRVVFSLFGFSPIVASIYVLQSVTRSPAQWQQDVRTTVQFLCVFGCIGYFAMYWSPLEMYLFLINDFMTLTLMDQCVSVFIAVSISAFLCILCQNCGITINLDTYGEKHVELRGNVDIYNESEKLKVKESGEGILNVYEHEDAHVQKKKRKRRRRRKKKKAKPYSVCDL